MLNIFSRLSNASRYLIISNLKFHSADDFNAVLSSVYKKVKHTINILQYLTILQLLGIQRYSNKNVAHKSKLTNESGLILILDTAIVYIEFILINSYRVSGESEQLNTFLILLILIDDFILYFIFYLWRLKCSVSKLVERFNIWRIKYLKAFYKRLPQIFNVFATDHFSVSCSVLINSY